MFGVNDRNSGSNSNAYTIVRLLSRNKNGLRICHINAQSLVHKIDELNYIFKDSGVDIICISETWFSSNMPDSLFILNGFKLIRADRLSHAGGVAIYVKSNISFKFICKSPNESEIEYLFIELSSRDSRALIGTVYRPKRSINISPFIEFLNDLSLRYDNIVIAGDFNSNLLQESSLMLEMSSLGLYSCNNCVPTHFSNSCNTLLDLFFVCELSKSLLYDQFSCPVFSKHDVIFLTFDFQLQNKPIKPFFYRDFKNVDYNVLDRAIDNIDWNIIYNTPSVDDQASFIQNNIKILFDKFVPLKKKTVTRDKPWFTTYIKKLIADRDEAYSRWKRFKINEIHVQYKIIRNKVDFEI